MNKEASNSESSRQPVIQLFARYRTIFAAAWAHRIELAGPKRYTDEVAFLPAALSLQDTPVHPAPRRLAWGLIALFLIALGWSIVGQIDIVAIAPGRIIVGERTKLVQPLEASVVRRVLVKEGERVVAGQVLVELDPTLASADKLSLQEQIDAAGSEVYRTRALLNSLSKQESPTPEMAELGTDMSSKNTSNFLTQDRLAKPSVKAQLLAEWQDIRAKLAKQSAEADRRRAEIATVRQAIAKLEATVPLAQTREADFLKLVAQGYISGHSTQDKTRERIELEQDLGTQRARLTEAQSTLKESEQSKAAYRAETQRLLHDRNAQASTKLQQLQAEYSKADQRERLTQLTAPVSGVIQQLAIHSIGGVVTSAQPLMIVVPDSAGVTAEVTVSNLDIGFVSTGQTAEIKLETFPYTKYGTVLATVETVTADAVTDEKKGSYYPAILNLNQKEMLIDGKRIKLSPGMNITAEIKTGKRRVIEYLLSPVQRVGSESLRER